MTNPPVQRFVVPPITVDFVETPLVIVADWPRRRVHCRWQFLQSRAIHARSYERSLQAARRRSGADAMLQAWPPLRETGQYMVSLQELRHEKRAAIIDLARRHGARNIRVYGSVARGQANDSSDLDLLVEWAPDRSLLDVV